MWIMWCTVCIFEGIHDFLIANYILCDYYRMIMLLVVNLDCSPMF